MKTTYALQLLKELKLKQDKIVYESDEDEGAAEYYAELQSVIMVIEAGASDESIKSARELVGA